LCQANDIEQYEIDGQPGRSIPHLGTTTRAGYAESVLLEDAGDEPTHFRVILNREHVRRRRNPSGVGLRVNRVRLARGYYETLQGVITAGTGSIVTADATTNCATSSAADPE
jgi:hypothetical protein